MTQRYGFKDIAAVEYKLAKPNRVQLSGFEPIEKRLSRLDNQITAQEKRKITELKTKKADVKKKFIRGKSSFNSIFGPPITDQLSFRR